MAKDGGGENGELKNALVFEPLGLIEGDGRGDTSERVELDEKEDMLNVEDDDGEKKFDPSISEVDMEVAE